MGSESKTPQDKSPLEAPTELSADSSVVVHILPVQNIIVFPGMIAAIVVSDDRAKAIVEEAHKTDRRLAIFHRSPVTGESNAIESPPGYPALVPVGTLSNILRRLEMPDGTMRLLVHGNARVRIAELVAPYPLLRARVIPFAESTTRDIEMEATMKKTTEDLNRAIALSALPEELGAAALNVDEAGKLADLVASNLSLKIPDLVSILNEPDTKKRLERVYSFLARELNLWELGNKITNRVRAEVDKHQRDFFLREQIRQIRRELGENDPQEREIEELRERIESSNLPEKPLEVARRELGRLESLPPAAAEYGVIRTYLDAILDFPWSVSTDARVNLAEARRVLDRDHYGLEKVADRIIEYLGVLRLRGGSLKGPILCLVGPPGVGKTSLGRSVAESTGRKFARISLGGLKDEAEIRGHRRTYIGAMPGRLVKALRDCEANNPLIVLDEIDKVGLDWRGDPASALLEVLDPEQNHTFNDNYMDMPIDLSKVLFIATANTTDTIPRALADRMEVIRIPGYTEAEKLEIARRHLVPREIENNGLKGRGLRFSKGALQTLVSEYTSEAGVRSLQREIAAVCRKVGLAVAEHDEAKELALSQAETPVPVKRGAKTAAKSKARKPAPPPVPEPRFKLPATLSGEQVRELLGPPQIHPEVAERTRQPGVAIGLAWTPVGGAILHIEANRFDGKGDLRLTGQLGDVMRESAQAAFSYLRANRESYGMAGDAFSKFDYHLHVPAGATPKDGPSAGVAMAAALASLIAGKRLRDFTAMTGEISLRGLVLPVGGIKEKVLAAHRAGVKIVMIPKQNEKDLLDIPAPVRKALKIHLVSEVHEALKLALP